MNALGSSLGHSLWLAAAGAALVHFLWQAALVGCGLALAHAALRRASARVRYLLDCLALFSLPLLFGSTLAWARLWSADASLPASLGAILDRVRFLLPYLAALWAFGVVGFAAYSVGGWWLVRRARRGVDVNIPEAWRPSWLRLRKLAGVNTATLGVSAAVAGPCVVGWWRPLVLLPLSALAALPIEHLEALLAHELAHIRRCDYLVNLLQRAVEILFFFHPAVWWISAQVSEEREHCCDDAAIALCGNRWGYARALVDLAESSSRMTSLNRAAALKPAPTMLAAGGGSLRRRVGRIVGRPLAAKTWGFASSMAVFAAFGILAVGLAPALPSTKPARSPRAAVLPAPVRAVPVRLSVPVPGSLALVPSQARVRLTARRAVFKANPAPPPQRPVVVAFSLAAVETCAPQLELVRHVSSDGVLVWVDVQPVLRCEQPVRVWVLTT